MSERISVVIPVYNVEKYLRQAVDSVINQSYRNLEIILVDDGSTDNCGAICDAYKNRFGNVKVIHKKNEGLGMARNSGIEIATGEYVYFHDSDDYIAEDEVEKLHNAIKKYGVDMAITGFTSVDDAGNILKIRKYKKEVFPGDKARTEMAPRLIGSAPDKKDSLEMASAGSMYSLKIIKKYNVRFVSERKLKNEDMVFNIDFLQYANGGCTVDSTGQFYRNNPESLSHRYQEDRFERDKDFYRGMLEKLKDLQYGHDVIERLQRHFFIHILIAIKQINDRRGRHSFFERYRMAKKLCGDDLVQKVIDEYPRHRMGIRQRCFIFLVKHRFALALVIMVH